MNRPPPYFPQNQLSPPSPNKYRNFKITIAVAVLILLGVLAAVGYGIFYLIRAFMS
jgi:hypothetical protein